MTQVHTAVYAKIQQHGLRLTDARKEIVDTLSSAGEPLTIQDIAGVTDVDQATVYRNITVLTSAGILEEINAAGHGARYALTPDHHHDHVACKKCGRIVHITCTLPHAPLPKHKQFASIDHHEVTYYGLCTTCS